MTGEYLKQRVRLLCAVLAHELNTSRIIRVLTTMNSISLLRLRSFQLVDRLPLAW